ncbi:MAG: ABC transporter permease subunit [Nocardioides sp.]|uniref:ABC transporter permease n=1 Tax=Nocardioides sp. TaxID=35761 RepID=UPI0039E27533
MTDETTAVRPPTSGPVRAARRRRLDPVLRTVTGWAVLIALWQFVATVVLAGTHLMGSPLGIVADIADKHELYLRALGFTGRTALWGYLYGNAVAIGLAVLVAAIPRSERLVLRVALVAYCLPLVAIGPLLRLIFGLNDGPQITLSALAVFYMTLVPLLVGLRAVPSTWTDLVHSYGRGRITTLLVVRLRACAPYLSAGLQVSVPAAFLGALVGEFTGAERGVGVLSILALRSLDTNGLWALATLSAAVSVLVYAVVGWGGRLLTPDQPTVLMATPPTARRRAAWQRWLTGLTEGVVTLALVLLTWLALLHLLDLNPYFAKRPADVWAWLVTDPEAAANRSEIATALRSTALVAVPGYFAGLVLGVGMASLFELAPSVRRTMTPVAVALRCVPIISIAPLLVQALGRGVVGTTVVVAMMTFFPTLVACMYGLRQTPGQVTDLFETFAAPPWRTLLLARIPAMMPAFLSSARIAAPSALLAATVAEWLATGTGVGNLLAVTAATSRYDALWSTVVVVTAVAVAAYWLVEVIERRILRVVAPEQSTW